MSSKADYSILSIIKIVYPLILSSFSIQLMFSCDRIMLSQYNINDMNVMVAVGTLLYIFECSICNIVNTSEVLAGQFNGSKQYHNTAKASWQMLYLSLIFFLIFSIIGIFAGKYLISENYFEKGNVLFKYMMIFMFISPAISSINGFFIGIKNTKIISINTLIGNALNIILSYIFIFGVTGYIQPYGIMGVVISSSISLMFQLLLIMLVFTSKKYSIKYHTKNFSFDKKIFFKCLEIGVPSAIGIVLELTGYYTIQILILKHTPQNITSYNITLNIMIFTFFMIIALNKGVSGLGANIIGSNNQNDLKKLLLSALKLHIIFTAIIAFFTILFPEKIIHFYTKDYQLVQEVKRIFPYLTLYYFFDGIGWIICGLVIAGGDSKFVMFASIFTVWVARVIPIYYLLNQGYHHLELTWQVSLFSAILYVIIFVYRFIYGNWLKVNITEEKIVI